MKLLLPILFLFTWFTNLANATPVFTKVVLPSYELTFSKTENVIEESFVKIGVHNFARSGIEENIVQPSHFSTTKQSSSFLKDAFQNFGVLHLEKSLAKSWVGSQDFSKKEKLSLVENRAREVLEDDVQGAGNNLLNAFKSGFSKESILAIPKGSRPNPSTYLNQSYIDNHIAQFNVGVTKFSSNIPAGSVGPPSGTFVMPKSQADALIQQAGGDVSKLEDLLGLNRGDLGANPIRIDVQNPSGLRMPDGNELGANTQWLPGGKTSGGINEATVNQIQQGTYTTKSAF